MNRLKSTFEEAEKVAEALGKEYEKADWLRGVAIKHGDLFGFYVEVRVADAEKAEIPEAVDGVWVFVEERSKAIAL
jgi:hypothetical protein